MQTPEIKTKRLCLRPLRQNDAPAVFTCWMNDRDVAKYMFWTSCDDIKKTEAWVAEEIQKIPSEDWFRWAVADAENGVLVGTVLVYLEPEYGLFQIGYNFGKAYWGQGFATEAMRAVLEFARNTLGLHKLVARYAKENGASGKVLRKLGFRYVCDIPFEANAGAVLYEGEELRVEL